MKAGVSRVLPLTLILPILPNRSRSLSSNDMGHQYDMQYIIWSKNELVVDYLYVNSSWTLVGCLYFKLDNVSSIKIITVLDVTTVTENIFLAIFYLDKTKSFFV